jgi:hypothetical protein
MDWKELCATTKLKEEVTKALDKEMHSLCDTHGVLQLLSSDDEDYQVAVDTESKVELSQI